MKLEQAKNLYLDVARERLRARDQARLASTMATAADTSTALGTLAQEQRKDLYLDAALQRLHAREQVRADSAGTPAHAFKEAPSCFATIPTFGWQSGRVSLGTGGRVSGTLPVAQAKSGCAWRADQVATFSTQQQKSSEPASPKIFLRQGFTESGPEDAAKIQLVYDKIQELSKEYGYTMLNPPVAYHRDNFKEAFTEMTGLEHTPANFWNHRKPLIESADYMFVVRSGLSESTALEIGWKLAHESATNGEVDPWKKIIVVKTDPTEIKTTMLRNAHVVDTSELRQVFERLTPQQVGSVS